MVQVMSHEKKATKLAPKGMWPHWLWPQSSYLFNLGDQLDMSDTGASNFVNSLTMRLAS